MTLRPFNTRCLAPLSILLCTLLMAACGSGNQNTPSNTTPPANAAKPAVATTDGTPAATPGQPAVSTGDAAKPKLNLNTASESDFMSGIPGFGKRMAHEFDEYRPYKSVQQFRKEIGKYVDAAQVAEYEKYVYVPISVNEADAATLQQMPGLDAKEAEALIAARPYKSNEAFLSKLSGSVSEAELAVAKTYLNER